MRYTYLKLIDFKRLPLRELEVFEKEFISDLTMISGPNGSGKSSIFNELTPLPSDKAFFGSKGYKEIHIEKDRINYVIISDFSAKSAKFSFLVDGEEQNTAGIVTTQRALAFQYFNITPTIHEILTGAEDFCDMSLPTRKKLFSTITNMNIDAVLEGYNKVKEEQRTATNLLKSQLNTYKIEESKLMDKSEVEARRSDLRKIEKVQDSLLGLRGEIASYGSTGASRDIYSKVMDLRTSVAKFKEQNYVQLTAYPRKDLDSLRKDKHSKLEVLSYILDEKYKLLEVKSSELKLLNASTSDNLSELEEKRKQLTRYIEVRKDVKLVDYNNDPSIHNERLTSLHKLESSLVDVVNDLPVNCDSEGIMLYTKDRYERLLEVKNNCIDKLQEYNAEEIAIRSALTKVNETTGSIQCPSCDHTWDLRDALKTSIHKEGEIERLTTLREEIKVTMKETEESLESIRDYFSNFKIYSGVRKDTLSVLNVFWNKVDSEELVFNQPEAIWSLVNKLSNELFSIGEAIQAETELLNIENKIKDTKIIESASLDSITSDVNFLSGEVTSLQEGKLELSEELKLMDKLEILYSKLETMETTLSKSEKELKEYNLNDLTKELLNVIDSQIRESRMISSSIENDLRNVDTIEYTLKQYQSNIDDTKESIKVLDIVLKELCPKSGLIAKSVSSFLNTIIHNINNTIDKIWDYKMVLNPIDVESDSLNYRFKVEVEDRTVIEDIGKVSKGMKEAINLSFKLVMYRLLKLNNYPLYLDELASNMDVSHSSNMVNLVHNLSTGGRFSQIYLITHKENFGFLRDLDKVEL